MTNPVWKKVSSLEPGLYWSGSDADVPQYRALVHIPYTVEFMPERWYARIGDLPPDPVMPQPELKEDDCVIVGDNKDCLRLRRHFAGWAKSGSILCWVNGGTKWSADNRKTAWKYWKLPTAEELNS